MSAQRPTPDHALLGHVESQPALPSSSTCPLGQVAPGRTICQIDSLTVGRDAMAARKSKRQKRKRHKSHISPVRRELLRSGYVAGFIEALRLQNGMPAGVTLAKIRSERTNWAQRAFETHSLDPVLGVIANDETMKRTKAGAPPNFRFVGRLAKSYLPEKFVRVSVPAQMKHMTAKHVSSAHSTTEAEESQSQFRERPVLIDSRKKPAQRFEFSQNGVASTNLGKP
jgi:hypothetical protein